MRTKTVSVLSAAVIAAVVIGGVLSAYTANNVVPNSYAGQTRVAVNITVPQGLIQRHPFGKTVTPIQSGEFSDRLKVVGANADVTYVVTSANSNLYVTSDGEIYTTDGPLAVGTYTVSGTDSKGANESGVWSYTLTVSSSVGNANSG